MSPDQNITSVAVPSLQHLVARGEVWSRMAAEYGVANPVPPWKSSLDGMCDALDDEGVLARDVYGALPFPESQLVALAHSLIGRGVIDEQTLAARMEAVRARL